MREISLENISVRYADKLILNHFSYTFKDKQCYILTGASGKGKTTLLKTIMGLRMPEEGQLHRPKDFRFSAAFQEDRLLPELTTVDNLLFVLPQNCRRMKAEAEKYLREILPEDALSKYPSELSGGMCRRVAVARALFAPSEAVALDEPFDGLDEETAKHVSAFISAHRDGRLLILATHHPELAPVGISLAL